MTSREADYGIYRALKTLYTCGMELDEIVFEGRTKKGPTLEKIRPHVFFDDQKHHAEAALKAGTVTSPVPSSNNEWEFIHWSHGCVCFEVLVSLRKDSGTLSLRRPRWYKSRQ